MGVKTCLLPAKTHKSRAKNTKFFCPLLDISMSGSPVAVPGTARIAPTPPATASSSKICWLRPRRGRVSRPAIEN